eukprot:11206460-Lingulodinium_polyedra.AAC.1
MPGVVDGPWTASASDAEKLRSPSLPAAPEPGGPNAGAPRGLLSARGGFAGANGGRQTWQTWQA